MNTRTPFRTAPLALALAAAIAAVAVAPTAPTLAASSPQQQYGPLERGYRTGYSDGYQAGWSDSLKGAPADYRSKADYQRADRAYLPAYGSLDDYSDGYRQGFEVGYDAGYNRRGFDSSVPPGLSRRGAAADTGAATSGVRSADRTGSDDAGAAPSGNAGQAPNAGTGAARGARSVPANTVMRVELLNRLSTDISQRGDRFEARVIEPAEYEGATVGGRVSNVQRAGKAHGRSQLQLTFDQIRLPNGDWQDFSAQVIEVIGGGGDVGEVDPEGGVRGRSSTKDDVTKVGASAGIGAIIGAIAGGGKGAGIGAVIGGAAGTAGVLTQRGKEIRLERGQQLRIRTSGR